MTAPLPGGEEFTELRDAEIDRVDLVGKAANGTRFLIAKAAADGHLTQPLVPAGMVRDLLAKADESTAGINDLPDSDFAYIQPGGSKDDEGKTTPRTLRHFPIQDAAHVRNALARASQSPFGDKALPKIRAAAKRFGIDTDEVTKTMPEPETVAKEDAAPVAVDDVMPEPPAGGTAETLPGSPDWETLDGDTAMAAVAVLGRVKAVLCWLADREAQEAVTGGDGGDAESSMDLSCMAEQIDCLIGQLAGFAAGEHLEAGMADELEAVGKAVAGIDPAALATLEGLGPVVKAGRVLSQANEDRIRAAVDSLTGVLNSLPQAPAADDVTKTEETTAVPEPVEKDANAELAEVADELTDVVAKTLAAAPRLTASQAWQIYIDGGRVAKAKGDAVMPVFDDSGKLVGTIDPSDLNPVTTAAPAEKPAEEPAVEEQPAADGGDTAPAAAPAADDAARVVPGTDTVQAPAEAPDEHKTPAVAKAVADAIKEAFAPFAEQVAKSADLAKAYNDLKERVDKMAQLPDDRRSPTLNGGTGTAGAVTRDGANPDGDELAALRKAIADEPDPVKKTALQKQAFFAEVKARFQG